MIIWLIQILNILFCKITTNWNYSYHFPSLPRYETNFLQLLYHFPFTKLINPWPSSFGKSFIFVYNLKSTFSQVSPVLNSLLTRAKREPGKFEQAWLQILYIYECFFVVLFTHYCLNFSISSFSAVEFFIINVIWIWEVRLISWFLISESIYRLLRSQSHTAVRIPFLC